MKKIILLPLILFVLKASAQDSTNKASGIITKKTFGPYKMEGNRISEKKLKAEIYKVPTAIPIYKKAMTSKTIGLISLLAGAGCLLLNGPQTRNGFQIKRNNGFLLPAIALYGVGFYFSFRSFKFTKTAIEQHNKNVKITY